MTDDKKSVGRPGQLNQPIPFQVYITPEMKNFILSNGLMSGSALIRQLIQERMIQLANKEKDDGRAKKTE